MFEEAFSVVRVRNKIENNVSFHPSFVVRAEQHVNGDTNRYFKLENAISQHEVTLFQI